MDDAVHRGLHPAIPQRGAREDGEDFPASVPLRRAAAAAAPGPSPPPGTSPPPRRRRRPPPRAASPGTARTTSHPLRREEPATRRPPGLPRRTRPSPSSRGRPPPRTPRLEQRNGQRNAAGVELARHVLDHPVEVGPGPVELVDDASRGIRAGRPGARRLRLRLHPPTPQNTATPRPERGATAPPRWWKSTCPGVSIRWISAPCHVKCVAAAVIVDPPLLLLRQVIHLRVAVVDLPHPVGDPGVVEEPLGEGRLPRVDVRDDPYVPEFRGGGTSEVPPEKVEGRRPGIARSADSADSTSAISAGPSPRRSAKKSRIPASRSTWSDPDAENGSAGRTTDPCSSAVTRNRSARGSRPPARTPRAGRSREIMSGTGRTRRRSPGHRGIFPRPAAPGRSPPREDHPRRPHPRKGREGWPY